MAGSGQVGGVGAVGTSTGLIQGMLNGEAVP
jgi:hypothetical protein